MTLFQCLRAIGLGCCILSAIPGQGLAQVQKDPQAVASSHNGEVPQDLIAELISTSLTEASATLPTVDWALVARMYHIGNRGVGTRDSLGCQVVPLRTVAIDPRLVPKRTILFIPKTVGLPVPGGGKHDGYWYASDTGGGIKGAMIDLFTGHGSRSMAPLMQQGLNLATLAASRVGKFTGCPPAWPQTEAQAKPPTKTPAKP